MRELEFNKNLKLLLPVVFVVMLCINVAMYFYIANSVMIFGKEINVLYIQVAFILLELFMLSGIYGKKQGIAVCLIYVLLVVCNVWFILANLV